MQGGDNRVACVPFFPFPLLSMAEVRANIDNSGLTQEGRETVKQRVANALCEAQIQATIRLLLVNSRGQLIISCDDLSEQKAQTVVGACEGIQEVYHPDPTKPRIAFPGARVTSPYETP